MNKIKQYICTCAKAVDAWAVIYVIAMIVPNVLLDFTESMNLWGKLANIIVPASIYLLLVSKVKRTGAIMLWLVIMMVMNAFQIVLYYLYGNGIIAIDMLINCVTSNPDEAGELLSNLTLPIIINVVIYVPLILWAVYASTRKPSLRSSALFRKRAFKIGFYTLSMGILIVVVAMLTSPRYRVNRDLYPFNVISNIVSASQRIGQSVNYHNTSSGFKYDAKMSEDSYDDELIVLVIGETSRAGNWQLFGYDRPTNPRLSQRDDLILFPRAVSQSNTTHKCVPLMLTPISPSEFDSIMYYKSAVTAFNEAGFSTSFYSNQAKNHSYTQFFSEEADTVNYLDGKHRFDHLLVEDMKKELSDTAMQRKLIVLHTYGSHFNYHDRYTPEFSYFTPDGSTNANAKHRPVLVNAYDNSIRYIDNYLADAIESLESTGRSAVLFFAADHGEDIFDDDRERFLHASPVATYWQLHVPMFIWMSDEYRSRHPEVVKAIQTNKDKYLAPSQSVFHTLMDLSGINTRYYDGNSSVASPKFKSPVPEYLNDYNEAVQLEESGLTDEDIRLLQNLGILDN